jgi:phage host-nuclease inhibitor protein Gam
MTDPVLSPSLDVPPPLSDEDFSSWLDADDVPAVDAWTPDGLASAEWAARRLARVRAQVDELDEQHQLWVEQLTDWYRRNVQRLHAEAAYFEERLEQFAIAERARTGVATLDLPSGVVRTTLHQPKVVVIDEAAALAWLDKAVTAAQREHVIRVERTIRLTELRKVVGIGALGGADAPERLVPVTKDGGEIMPGELGLAIEPAHVTASARTGPR